MYISYRQKAISSVSLGCHAPCQYSSVIRVVDFTAIIERKFPNVGKKFITWGVSSWIAIAVMQRRIFHSHKLYSLRRLIIFFTINWVGNLRFCYMKILEHPILLHNCLCSPPLTSPSRPLPPPPSYSVRPLTHISTYACNNVIIYKTLYISIHYPFVVIH